MSFKEENPDSRIPAHMPDKGDKIGQDHQAPLNAAVNITSSLRGENRWKIVEPQFMDTRLISKSGCPAAITAGP